MATSHLTARRDPGFRPEATVRHWVVIDLVEHDGRRVIGHPISPLYKSATQARRVGLRLLDRHPDAYLMTGGVLV